MPQASKTLFFYTNKYPFCRDTCRILDLNLNFGHLSQPIFAPKLSLDTNQSSWQPITSLVTHKQAQDTLFLLVKHLGLLVFPPHATSRWRAESEGEINSVATASKATKQLTHVSTLQKSKARLYFSFLLKYYGILLLFPCSVTRGTPRQRAENERKNGQQQQHHHHPQPHQTATKTSPGSHQNWARIAAVAAVGQQWSGGGGGRVK